MNIHTTPIHTFGAGIKVNPEAYQNSQLGRSQKRWLNKLQSINNNPAFQQLEGKASPITFSIDKLDGKVLNGRAAFDVIWSATQNGSPIKTSAGSTPLAEIQKNGLLAFFKKAAQAFLPEAT